MLFVLLIFGINPADIAVFTAINHVKAVMLRVAEHQGWLAGQIKPHHRIGNGKRLNLCGHFSYYDWVIALRHIIVFRFVILIRECGQNVIARLLTLLKRIFLMAVVVIT